MNLRHFFVTALLVTFLGLSSPAAMAYMDDITILESAEIVKLTDQKLIDTYIDVIVEMEASKAFHTTSGFTPKEYTAYKNLLRYRIQLLMEINKRGIEPPKLN